MERPREHDDVAVALAEMRPSPRAGFAAELDELVASGFQRAPRSPRGPLAALADRLRGLSPQRLLFTTGGTALAAIAIATVVVAGLDSDSAPEAIRDHAETRPAKTKFFSEMPAPQGDVGKPSSSAGHASRAAGAQEGSPGVQYSAPPPATPSDSQAQSALSELHDRNASATLVPFSRRLRHRDIERSAEIGLLAEPADIGEDSTEVFSAVHDARGIVVHSTTTAGRNAGAHFDLLIPSAKLGDALAAFSAIDEVRTRHEATTDITAPTVGLEESLSDSSAKIDGLLAQLATAETDSEREATEIELRRERHHAAALRARLDKLQRRADYSRVSLRIETGASATDSTGGWGIDDAFHDAGHILGIAAGVTVVALAVVAPLALILLLAWLAHRLWLRSRRERALDA
jgi:hypothetical protein